MLVECGFRETGIVPIASGRSLTYVWGIPG
jgi:hypothetical protein